MASTDTILNQGSGGSVMDESAVTQADTGIAAHRTRVVLGNDAGQLTDSEYMVRLLEQILLENRRHTTLLQLLMANTSTANNSSSLDELDAMRSD